MWCLFAVSGVQGCTSRVQDGAGLWKPAAGLGGQAPPGGEIPSDTTWPIADGESSAGGTFRWSNCHATVLFGCTTLHQWWDLMWSPSINHFCVFFNMLSCSGVEEHLGRIQSDLMSLSVMLASPHSVDLRPQMEDWLKSLHDLGKIKI